MSEAFSEQDSQEDGVAAGLAAESAQEAERETKVDEFEQRVMSDPDFAWKQIRVRDQQNSKTAQELKDYQAQMQPLQSLADLAGGADGVIELAKLGSDVSANEDLMKVIENFHETGRVELPKVATDGSDDEWVDPDVQKLVGPLQEKIGQLETQLQNVTRLAGAAEATSNEAGMMENVTAGLKHFEGDDEVYKQAFELLEKDIETTKMRAKQGDLEAGKLINQLAGPGGAEMVQKATFKVYLENAGKLHALEAGARENEEAQTVLGKSTDARVINASGPGGLQLPAMPKRAVPSHDSVANVMAAIREQKGMSPG